MPAAHRPHVGTLIVLALPFAILAAGFFAGLAGGGWYTWLVREDGPAENLQVLACAGAALGCAVLARRWWSRKHPLRALTYAALAFALAFVAGEEISWGQRAVGWSTPPALARMNRQAESNLHNIVGLEAPLHVGLLALLACCGLVPLLLRKARARRPPAWLMLPAPILTPYFLLPLLGHLVGFFFEPPPRYVFAWRESAELMELIVYLGICFTVVLHLRDQPA